MWAGSGHSNQSEPIGKKSKKGSLPGKRAVWGLRPEDLFQFLQRIKAWWRLSFHL